MTAPRLAPDAAQPRNAIGREQSNAQHLPALKIPKLKVVRPDPAPKAPVVKLSESELQARFASGYACTYEGAIAYAETELKNPADAQDLFQAAILDLWAAWTRDEDPVSFPKDNRHFRATVFKRIKWKIATGRSKAAAICDGTTLHGKLEPETPLDYVHPPLMKDASPNSRAPWVFLADAEVIEPRDDTPDQADLARLLWTTVADKLSTSSQNVLREWCQQDYSRQNTAEALGMNLAALDKQLLRIRGTLRTELATVERGHLMPDSPWYGLIQRCISKYDQWQKDRAAAKAGTLAKWIPLTARIAAERTSKRADVVPIWVARRAAGMALAVDRRLDLRAAG